LWLGVIRVREIAELGCAGVWFAESALDALEIAGNPRLKQPCAQVFRDREHKWDKMQQNIGLTQMVLDGVISVMMYASGFCPIP